MWRALAAARRLLRPAGVVAGGAPRAEPPPLRAQLRRGCAATGGGGGPGALEAAERCQPADAVLPEFNIDLVVALLRQENAKDICVIQLSPELKYCDYFIIVSGFSTRHLHAMANYMLKMYKHLKEEGVPHTQIEGKETDDWLCIDFELMKPEKLRASKFEPISL
ncbi:mitochondrial assembly of ribosomal large subunit protein 1 isoform X2 [Anomalospiza imberbis]|uniref:mitochondrial assembly of ribosomal large subunit protein 1 isoform X2 n=1 Tax=Anomalospiza imberbis TaxID=187417 RepID=UPI00358F73EC